MTGVGDNDTSVIRGPAIRKAGRFDSYGAVQHTAAGRLQKNKKERRCIMRKPYNTPHRTHVVKTRLTDEEHELFLNQCRTYGISQSEMLRQSMTRLQIKPVIHVSAVNDELLSAIGKLTAEYGRIGSNLNQIARTLNEWHSPYPQLVAELRTASSDLAALKFEVLEKVGEAVDNVQTYQI